MTPITISDRLFSKLPRYFGSVDVAIREVIQNAYRSYCPLPLEQTELPVIRITWDDKTKTMVVTDHGRGITDPGVMLSPAASDWAHDVEHDQDPAGMGVFGILAWCESVTWVSAFGTLTVESDKFFNDAEYRRTLVDQVKPEDRSSGTMVVMQGVRGFGAYSTPARSAEIICQGFARVRCYVNDIPVPRPDWLNGVVTVSTPEYDVISYARSGSRTAEPPKVAWHGHMIPVDREYLPAAVKVGEMAISTFTDAVIHIKGEKLVTPRLPDRTALVYDERTVQTIQRALVAHAEVRLERALRFIQERNPQRVPEMSEFTAWCKNHRDIDGFQYQLRQTTGWQIADTRRTFEKNNGEVVRESEVILEDETVDDASVLVVTEQGQRWFRVSDSISGIIFNDGKDDPVSAAGYSWRDGDVSHVLVIKVGKTREAGGVVHAEGTAQVGVAEINEDGGVDLESFDPLDTCSKLYLNDQDIDDCGDLVGDMLIVGKIDDARYFYGSLVCSNHRDDWNGEDTFDHWYETEFATAWERLEADLAGEEFIELPTYALRRLAGDQPFTLDLAESTLTRADGRVVKLSIRNP